MSHTIVTDVCEGVADCVEACPVSCIDQGPAKMRRGLIGIGLILPPALIAVSVYRSAP